MGSVRLSKNWKSWIDELTMELCFSKIYNHRICFAAHWRPFAYCPFDMQPICSSRLWTWCLSSVDRRTEIPQCSPFSADTTRTEYWTIAKKRNWTEWTQSTWIGQTWLGNPHLQEVNKHRTERKFVYLMWEFAFSILFCIATIVFNAI